MNASGYREKAPQSKQDEDTRKLAALLGELEIVDEAESKLDANNWRSFRRLTHQPSLLKELEE